VAFRFNLAPDLCDGSVGRYEERGALDAHDFLAVHVLFLEDVEEFGYFFVGVGKQSVREFVLFLELLLRFGCIRRDAEYGESGADEFCVLIAESAGFDGAAGGVGPGIEEEHDGFTLEGGESDWLSVFVGQSEVGSELVDVHEQISIPQSDAGRHADNGDCGVFVFITGTIQGSAAGEKDSAGDWRAGDF